MFKKKPLSFLCLKAVFTYTEANLRIRLTQQVPSLELFDKVLPLCISNLHFFPLGLSLNDTSYQWSIVGDYPKGSTIPYHFRWGPVTHDVDEYGFPAFPSGIWTPGDLALDPWDDGSFYGGMSEDNIVFRLERELENIEEAIVTKRNMEAHEENSQVQIVVKELLDTVTGENPKEVYHWKPLYYYERPKLPLAWSQEKRDRLEARGSPCFSCGSEGYSTIKELIKESYDEIEQRRERKKAELVPYSYKRENIRPPWTHFLQFSVTKGSGAQKLYKFPYSIPLEQALKKLIIRLLGSKAQGPLIRVKHLEIHRKLDTLRLPENFKLKVECLTIQKSKLEYISPILKSPLKSLKMEANLTRRWDIQSFVSNEIIQKVEILKIENSTYERISWAPVLLKLSNPIVKLENEGRKFSQETFLDLVKDWIQQGRPIGMAYSFGVRKMKSGRTFLNLVARMPEAWKVNRNLVKLPINNGNRLAVRIQEVKDLGDDFWKNSNSKIVIELKVLGPIRH